MKKYYLFIFLCFIVEVCKAQNSFTLLISNPYDERPGDLIELSDGSFILSSGFFPVDSNLYAQQKFFRISKEGQVSFSKIYNNENGTCVLSTMLPISDTNIFCIGDWHNIDENDNLMVASVDSELNIHWMKTYGTEYAYQWNGGALINSSGNIVYTTCLTDFLDYSHFFLQEFSQSGDSITSKTDTSQLFSIVFDIIEFPSNGIYKIPGMSFSTHSAGQVLKIDSLFNICEIDSIPQSVYNCNTLKKRDDTSYYLSGNIHYQNNYDYACMLLNKNNDCLKMSVIGKSDTNDFAGTANNLDFFDKNQIFLGGTANISIYSTFPQQSSWYALSNFDSLLNIRWTKYYGGDAYYVLRSVIATKDGGAAMVGTRYDYPSQSYQNDIYIVKVNQDGVVTGINNSSFIHDAIVYPNPGKDYLYIKSGKQISGSEFRMFSIDGKECCEKNILEETTKLSTQNIPSGMYTWQLIYKNKIIETGKWIKTY
ncbi:MAG: T9SS type A sorting domain-containing protein [Bacteroidota bacterium]|nr:T9SS type A sorting domain-containing protein [Bacteroidota bacterium]